MANKRKDCSPEAQQDKDKVIRPYESLNQHPSVLNASDLHCSPVNTKSLNIVQKCEQAGIPEASSFKNIDVDTIYKLVVDLSSRVTSLEADVVKKDAEIFNLRRDHASLEKQLNDIRSENKKNEEEPFIEVLRREVPILSDAVAKNEKDLDKLKGEVKDLNESGKRAMEEDGIEEDHPTLQEILANQKEEKSNFLKESRKNHLEREHQSQYTMRDTVRVTGVPYKNGENTNDLVRRIAHSIGVPIRNEDISVSHRTGKRMAGRPRAIICRFTRRDTKYQILQNRKLARHITSDDDGNPVSIFIDEKLTPMRANVCKLLRQEKVKHHTKDGKIFITKENSSEWTVLDTTEDWIKWDKSDKVKMDLGIYPKF